MRCYHYHGRNAGQIQPSDSRNRTRRQRLFQRHCRLDGGSFRGTIRSAPHLHPRRDAGCAHLRLHNSHASSWRRSVTHWAVKRLRRLPRRASKGRFRQVLLHRRPRPQPDMERRGRGKPTMTLTRITPAAPLSSPTSTPSWGCKNYSSFVTYFLVSAIRNLPACPAVRLHRG